jgi:hypothetical protein
VDTPVEHPFHLSAAQAMIRPDVPMDRTRET